MKYCVLLTLFILSVSMQAQHLKFSTGTNFTEYDYESTANPSELNLRRGQGSFYAFGFTHAIGTSRAFAYELGAVVNEFNALGGNQLNIYSWKTAYLGLNAGLSIALINSESGFKTNLNVGLSGNTLLNGQQSTNGFPNDLKNQDDFSGMFLEMAAGLSISHPISDKADIGIGYRYGTLNQTGGENSETLTFLNHQLQFSLHFKLINNEKESTDPTVPAE
ncbi:hypothetical protein N9L94_07145 [Robiginitalea sp.]|nr:hypothetical protein [Robiginitalea sp.]